MAVAVGDKIPDVEAKVLSAEGMPESVSTGQLLGSGKVVLFGLPGAFTPGCSKAHLPSYVDGAADLAGKGVEKIVCVSINDVWVQDAWAEAQGAKGAITMLADGNGTFSEAMGMTFDGSGYGLGTRSLRYAAVVENGIVTALHLEENPGQIEASTCQAVLADL